MTSKSWPSPQNFLTPLESQNTEGRIDWKCRGEMRPICGHTQLEELIKVFHVCTWLCATTPITCRTKANGHASVSLCEHLCSLTGRPQTPAQKLKNSISPVKTHYFSNYFITVFLPAIFISTFPTSWKYQHRCFPKLQRAVLQHKLRHTERVYKVTVIFLNSSSSFGSTASSVHLGLLFWWAIKMLFCPLSLFPLDMIWYSPWLWYQSYKVKCAPASYPNSHRYANLLMKPGLWK